MNEEKKSLTPQGEVNLTPSDAYFCQMDCYRMNSLLRQAERLIEDLPIQEKQLDRDAVEDAKLIVQSAMIILKNMTRRIEVAVEFRREDDLDDPSDL